MNYQKQKHLAYGKSVQKRLLSGDLPGPIKQPSLFFLSVPEIHLFTGDAMGWERAKSWNDAGYLALVMPVDERTESFIFPVKGCFVFLHLSRLGKFINGLVGQVVEAGAIGYQILLYSITDDTPANQIVKIGGETCQKSTAVLYPEYYNKSKK